MSPNPLGVPSGVAKLCAPEFRLVRACVRAPKQRGLGVSTFPGTRDGLTRAEVWAARVGWSERAGVGPWKGALGPEHGRARSSAGAGPNLRAKRVARSEPNSRRGGTGRIVSARLGREDWAESAGLGGREWRFSPLCAATTAREGAGDGGECRLGYAMLGRGVVRLGSVGIDRNFIFFERFSSFRRGISEFNRRKSGELRGGNRGVLFRGVSRIRSRGEIRARGRDFEGSLGRSESREGRESVSEIGTVRGR
ncbi:hypothetical protein CRG98_018785 [Punica granatum]|uniref:Uncharacterized protein n=1 Tax=Punica granatum TaxID=22663 RepID=A0A2I0JZB5_PUNGR|nr:hypothetical protein CRG98_018785 [Punica granatum]